jgi:Pentapeptide repeats (8 copies)
VNKKHLAVLEKGVAAWNAWRRRSQVPPDLEGADLRDANLQDVDLTGATLRHAILTGAILTGAILTGAILIDATLTDAALSDTELIGATLMGANPSAHDPRDAVYVRWNHRVGQHCPQQHIVQSTGCRMISASNGLPEALTSAPCTPAVPTTVWTLRQQTRHSGRGGGNDPVVQLPNLRTDVDQPNEKDVIAPSLAHTVRAIAQHHWRSHRAGLVQQRLEALGRAPNVAEQLVERGPRVLRAGHAVVDILDSRPCAG